MKFKFFLIKFIMAFFIGCAIFHYVSKEIVFSSAPTPWIILTLLLFSSSYCVQALFKLPEATEHPSLTSDELRRLKPIIYVKNRRLVSLSIYYLASSLFVVLGFFSVPTASEFYPKFITLTGGMVISSFYSFFFIKATMDEIQKFKSKLIHRAEDEKKRKELTDKLKKAD